MTRQERILFITKELCAIQSVSGSEAERDAARWLYGYLAAQPYFAGGNGHFGAFTLEGDRLRREAVWALVRGRGAAAVVLLGHYDVVSAEDYGALRGDAFSPDALDEKLCAPALPPDFLNDDARRDLESGEWLFGRGAADMKGGIAVHLDYLTEAAEAAGSDTAPQCSLLFLAVPDEEAFSAGMRGAGDLLLDLKQRFTLDYKLLLNSEPARHIARGAEQTHIVPIGSGGKCLPVILARGVQAHAGNVFDGLNPLGILTALYDETELSIDFVNRIGHDGRFEAAMPPSWMFMRDLKDGYDVSLPLEAAGFLNVLDYRLRPGAVMEKLKAAACRAVRSAMDKARAASRAYCEMLNTPPGGRCEDGFMVLSYDELAALCSRNDAAAWEALASRLYREAADGVADGGMNYPEATIYLMRKALEAARVTVPAVVIAFAPPYYPSVCSLNVPGAGSGIPRYFEALRKVSREAWGVDMETEHYFGGISDCSYAAAEDGAENEAAVISRNMPLWGGVYRIDFEKIRRLGIPFMILGPRGKDYHQRTERVHVKDLTERIPALTRTLCGLV